MKSMLRLVGLLLAAAPVGGQAVRQVPLPQPNGRLAMEFTAVSSVRELPTGRVLVVDASERALYVADFSNNSVSRIGRNGSGPGEYQQPGALLAISSDSTILLDARNGRWLLLAGTEIVGSIGPDAPVISAGTRTPNGADARGNVIAIKSIATGPVTPTSMPRRDSVLLVRLARATGAQDTLAMLRARPSVIRTEGPASAPTAVSVVVNPLSSAEAAALYPDGWVAIARLDPYRIEWINPAGQHVLGPVLPFQRVRLDEREQRAFLQRQAERSGRPPVAPASYPDWPESLPPFLVNALLPATDGNLWIRRPASTANLNPPYDVVDRRGQLVARIAISNDITVIGFGNGTVYTVVTDENGIQKLERRPMPRL